MNEFIIYSCLNNNEIKQKIKLFPTLYFELNEYNIKFLFSYKELFRLFNNKLYFMIIFKNESDWTVGEIFLRKYLTTFNHDSKTISFYKNQVDEINNKTDIAIKDIENKNESLDITKIILIILLIILLIALFIIGIYVTKKLKKLRKKRANELKDENDEYDYTPEDKENSNNIDNNNLLIN